MPLFIQHWSMCPKKCHAIHIGRSDRLYTLLLSKTLLTHCLYFLTMEMMVFIISVHYPIIIGVYISPIKISNDLFIMDVWAQSSSLLEQNPHSNHKYSTPVSTSSFGTKQPLLTSFITFDGRIPYPHTHLWKQLCFPASCLEFLTDNGYGNCCTKS